MSELATVGIDLAKSVFQIHGVDENGGALVRRQLRGSQLLAFFQNRPRYLIGMEACGAMAQIMRRRRLKREAGSGWLSGMLMRKKTKIVAIALAHRMVRTIFAVLRDGSRYEPQVA